MKRTVFALALCLGVVGGCTDYRSDIFIQGRIAPADGTCTYQPGSSGTTFIKRAVIDARGEQLVSGKLSLIVGFQVINNTTTPDVANANGESTSLATRDDAQVHEVDIDVADLNGGAVASETLLASGYIPGNGGNGVVLVDIMGTPLADAIRSKMTFPNANPASEQLVMTVVAKGKLVSGSDFETEPFQHELDVNYTDYFASNDGTATVALLPDAGHATVTIASDGTQTLVDDGDALFTAVVFGKYPDGGGIPVDQNDPDAGFRSGLIGADGGIFPTCE